MQPQEARRITGRHLLLDGPGAALEVEVAADDDVQAWLERFEARVRAAAARIELVVGPLVCRRHRNGLTVAVRLPADGLTAGAELLEWAASDATPHGEEEQALALSRASEHNPALMAALAARQGEPVFMDDEGLTIGLGVHAHTWPLDAIPAVDDLPHGRAVPLAYVTGTNGKTTTSRLLARMGAEAGLVVGLTSSDAIVVGGQVLESGDWTGPGAARTVLRDTRVQLGVLETARGGLLRRGLALDGVDAAVITNVADDHLGDWGIDTVGQMATVKFLVAAAVRPGGVLVVHGRCPELEEALAAARADRPDLRVRRFADAGPAPDLDAWVADGQLWVRHEGQGTALLHVADMPIAFGGHARHNVENALAAALGALALGMDVTAIRAALAGFRPTVAESAGRLNVFKLPVGATVVVDFAHNPAGLQRLVDTVATWPARRRTVVLGQAGDRSEDDLRGLVEAAMVLPPDHVYIKELPNHLRGRPLGEVSERLRAMLLVAGMPADALDEDVDEDSATRRSLAHAQDGELLLLLIHDGLEEALVALHEVGAVDA